ncbi:MAG: c-type cytochrome [Trueperaceae bacterium]
MAEFARYPYFRVTLMAGLIVGALLTGMAVMAQSDGNLVLDTAEVEQYGSILVDGEGFVLYVFLGDQTEDRDAPVSTCDTACARTWPPLTTSTWPILEEAVGSEVDTASIDRIELADGTNHLAYGGWPLYRFIGDREPLTASGQGLGEDWYVLSSVGEPVRQADSTEGAAAPEEGEEFDALMAEGASVFARTCGNCHGRQGEGESGLGPRLVGHTSLGSTSFLLNVILRGYLEMPPQGPLLSDREIAAVATYVRNSWVNDFGIVTEDEVRSLR